MKKTSLKKSHKLLMILGVLIVILMYVFITMPLQNTKDVMQIEILSLEAEIATLEMHTQNIDYYQESINEDSNYINKEMDTYPVAIREEDIIMWTLGLENTIGGNVSALSFSQPIAIMDFPVHFTDIIGENYEHIYAFSTQSAVTGTFNYSQMKNALDYIYSGYQPTSTDVVNLTYDATTGNLSVNMSVIKYYLDYFGSEYEPLPVPEVPLGVPNPFGSTITQ